MIGENETRKRQKICNQTTQTEKISILFDLVDSKVYKSDAHGSLVNNMILFVKPSSQMTRSTLVFVEKHSGM